MRTHSFPVRCVVLSHAFSLGSFLRILSTLSMLLTSSEPNKHQHNSNLVILSGLEPAPSGAEGKGGQVAYDRHFDGVHPGRRRMAQCDGAFHSGHFKIHAFIRASSLRSAFYPSVCRSHQLS
jgi:hypothetical protein